MAGARNGNVNRSAIRMRAPELLGGPAVGMPAALALEQDRQPREVAAGGVRSALVAAGAVVDVPDGG